MRWRCPHTWRARCCCSSRSRSMPWRQAGNDDAQPAAGRNEAMTGRRNEAMKLTEMDDQVTYAQQLQHDDGPVVLINQFNLAPNDTERFLQVWADDAVFMKQQPG